MRRFRFQFETVLTARKTREEEALRALGLAQQAYQGELRIKAALSNDLEASLRRRESLGIDPIGAAAFQLEDDFISGQKHRLIRAEQAILRASRGVEKALRHYLSTKRQTRMIETLREKAYLDFKKALAKYEQKQADEMTVMRDRLKEGVAV